MPKVLIVDDEPRILSLLHSLLKAEGMESVPAKDGSEALQLLRSQSFDLLVTDIRMSPMDGMELFRTARAEHPEVPVILLTAYGAVETAIEAMKLGAYDYLTKPFKIDEFLVTVKRAIEYNQLVAERDQLREALEGKYRFENIVSDSPAMHNICEVIQRVAPTDVTILIVGESGTGKEVVARAIHANSRRKDKPFVAINCAAIPENLLESELFGHVKGSFTGASSNKEGLFETANGGTLFLDEIATMPLSLQGKLLRVLQEREIRRVGGTANVPVDVRVLAASNANLEERVKADTFRQDLYYRLAVIPIEIPPLRDRIEDIIPLAQHFLRREAIARGGVTPRLTRESADIFTRYSWPGNVRELENAVRHAMTFAEGDEIVAAVLPARIVNSAAQSTVSKAMPTTPENVDQYRNQSLRTFLRNREREYMEYVLTSANGDKEKAAKTLKISMATLYRKMPERKTPGK
jgi:two-component system response regulator PilR (NtrC family)